MCVNCFTRVRGVKRIRIGAHDGVLIVERIEAHGHDSDTFPCGALLPAAQGTRVVALGDHHFVAGLHGHAEDDRAESLRRIPVERDFGRIAIYQGSQGSLD
jgi:hypothetical protein